jgi:hypothetical protein
VVYCVKVQGEPEITTSRSGNAQVRVPLQFLTTTTPPKFIAEKTVKLPLWKAGDLLDLLERGNQHWHELPAVFIELQPRSETDTSGTLRLRLDLQPALDMFTGEPTDALATTTSTETGPPKPGRVIEVREPSVERDVFHASDEPGAGGAPETANGPAGKPVIAVELAARQQQVTPPPAEPCVVTCPTDGLYCVPSDAPPCEHCELPPPAEPCSHPDGSVRVQREMDVDGNMVVTGFYCKDCGERVG